MNNFGGFQREVRYVPAPTGINDHVGWESLQLPIWSKVGALKIELGAVEYRPCQQRERTEAGTTYRFGRLHVLKDP